MGNEFKVKNGLVVLGNSSNQLLPYFNMAVIADVNNYAQSVFSNDNSGSTASVNLILHNDLGTDTTYYFNIGLNSSTYSDPLHSIAGANDSYIYAQTGSIVIGTANPGGSIKIFHGGTLAQHEHLRIDDYGIAINKYNKGTNATVDISGSLVVTGSTNISGNLYVNNTGIADTGIPLGEALTYQHTITSAAGMAGTSSLQDNGNGTITIISGSVRMYNNKNHAGFINRYAMPASTSLSLTNNTTNYVVVDYNNGSPIYRVTTDVDEINESDIFPAYTLYREDNSLHWIDWDSLGRGLPNKLHQRFVKTQRFARESGLILAATSSALTVTAGRAWIGAVRHIIPEVLSTSQKLYTYYHSASVWVYTTGSSWNSSSYDTGTSTASLNTNRYNTHWIYRHIDSGPTGSSAEIYLVLGSLNEAKLSDAQAAQPPASIPSTISSMGILLGRLIVREGSPTAVQVDSAFDINFNSSATTIHSDLGNLDFSLAGHTGFVGTIQTSSMTVLSSSYAITASYALNSVTPSAGNELQLIWMGF